jgi:uncharacterized protein (DUF3084 family)
MMMWLKKIVMRPKARRELARINEERNRVEEAIKRARRNKAKVSDLYAYAQKLTLEAHRWENYLR